MKFFEVHFVILIIAVSKASDHENFGRRKYKLNGNIKNHQKRLFRRNFNEIDDEDDIYVANNKLGRTWNKQTVTPAPPPANPTTTTTPTTPTTPTSPGGLSPTLISIISPTTSTLPTIGISPTGATTPTNTQTTNPNTNPNTNTNTNTNGNPTQGPTVTTVFPSVPAKNIDTGFSDDYIDDLEQLEIEQLENDLLPENDFDFYEPHDID